jgi:hypothetical protein
MAFGKKKVAVQGVDQSNVALLATEALAKQRSNRLQLGARLWFETPVLMHRWSEKAVCEMLGRMTGLKLPREQKDVMAEFEASWYRNTDGVPAIPCRIIKACIVNGALGTGEVVTKADLKRILRVRGYTTPICRDGKPITPASLVRHTCVTGGNTIDVRSRAVVEPGAYVDIVLEFTPMLSPDQVMAALSSGGSSIGLCDWRPDKGGEYGTFSVDEKTWSDKKDIDRILKACSVPEDVYEIPPQLLRAFNAIPSEQQPDKGRKVVALAENGKKNGAAAAASDA